MRWMNFFRGKEEKSKVACHWDGISVAGVGSVRLSNLPKNLNWLASRLLTLGQSPGVLFYGIALLARAVRANDCNANTDRNVYLNYSEGNSFLRIAYNSALYVLGAINNTCNFTIAEKQSGKYEQLGCLCEYTLDSREVHIDAYKVILYGQNVSTAAVQCMQDWLDQNCDEATKITQIIAIIYLSIVAGFLLFTCGGYFKDFLRDCFDRLCNELMACCRRREQQPLFLNPEEQEGQEQEEQLEFKEPPRRCLG